MERLWRQNFFLRAKLCDFGCSDCYLLYTSSADQKLRGGDREEASDTLQKQGTRSLRWMLKNAF